MRRFACMLVVCASLETSAQAELMIEVTRTEGTYPIATLGGEFTITPSADLQAATGENAPFQSFCLEANESLNPNGGIYKVILNDEAILGGARWPGEVPGPEGGDLLDPRTAYLYTEFRAGTLLGYDYGPNHGASALALQTAIWHIEAESIPYVDWRDTNVLSPKAQAFVNLGTMAGWTSIGNVRVLNVFGSGKGIYQDVLVMVPVPGAALLGMLGLGVAGQRLRRRMS